MIEFDFPAGLRKFRAMFPIQLDYYLDTVPDLFDIEVLQTALSGLPWGDEADLLRHSESWPAAVAVITDCIGDSKDRVYDYRVEVNLAHYPGRSGEIDNEMRVVKIALLRLLSELYECSVICYATEYQRAGKEAWSQSSCETLFCRGGRVFSSSIMPFDFQAGVQPASGWIPLDDMPFARLTKKGAIEGDPDLAAASMADWIEKRDYGHLEDSGIILPPKIERNHERTPEEREAAIAAEIAAEFPTEEEIDEEERQEAAHFERLQQWENGYETTSSKQLISSGISLPAPDALSDLDLPGKLREVIEGMAANNTYLYRTNHLSDRELYSWLWSEGLNDGIMDLSGLEDCGMHLDLLGSGDEESIRLGLIYYESAEERADWHASWPDQEIPAHIDPPYDRDRSLPKREY